MKTIDFTTVLAISIHDMKNSLSRVLNALDQIVDPETGDCHCEAPMVAQLQYEASRINDNLIQLLALYRQDQGLYQPNFACVSVHDLLEDGWLSNKPLIDHHEIECTIDCAPELEWSLDRQLISALLDNVITNTVRYTKSLIHLAARLDGELLVISIEDDGPGYPEAMLGHWSLDDGAPLNQRLGRTGVGLHFCAMVATCHANAAQHGQIVLHNKGPSGGGHFAVFLPPLAAG